MEVVARQTASEASILTVALLTCVHHSCSSRAPRASHRSSRHRHLCHSRHGPTTPSIRQHPCQHRPLSRSTTLPMPREVWLEVRGLSRRTNPARTHRLRHHRSATCSADVKRSSDIERVVERRVDSRHLTSSSTESNCITHRRQV